MDAAGLLRLELIDTWAASVQFVVVVGQFRFSLMLHATLLPNSSLVEDKAERDASINDSFAQVRPGEHLHARHWPLAVGPRLGPCSGARL